MLVLKSKYNEVVRQNEVLRMELNIVRSLLRDSDWQNMNHKRLIAVMERRIKQLESRIPTKE